jgi:hypothetical protein
MWMWVVVVGGNTWEMSKSVVDMTLAQTCKFFAVSLRISHKIAGIRVLHSLVENRPNIPGH